MESVLKNESVFYPRLRHFHRGLRTMNRRLAPMRRKRSKLMFCAVCALGASVSAALAADPSINSPSEYHIYAGNTHSHTSLTWSHGEQWVSDKSKGGKNE